jgi:hypothetical protein
VAVNDRAYMVMPGGWRVYIVPDQKVHVLKLVAALSGLRRRADADLNTVCADF